MLCISSMDIEKNESMAQKESCKEKKREEKNIFSYHLWVVVYYELGFLVITIRNIVNSNMFVSSSYCRYVNFIFIFI